MSETTTIMPSVKPEILINNLSTADDILSRGELVTEDEIKTVRKILRSASANVRLLFALAADPDTGEFLLKNVGEAWMLADLLYNGNLVPSSYTKPEQVVIALMKCTEIRVSPITGLSNMMVLNNRVSIWGDLGQALAQRSGLWSDHKAETIGTPPASGMELKDWPGDYGWYFSATRKGHDTAFEGSYTVADARRAGLWLDTRRKPWITDPERMMFNRARARVIRDGFADCLFGMALIEEQQDFAPSEPIRIEGRGVDAAHSPDDEPVEAGSDNPDDRPAVAEAE